MVRLATRDLRPVQLATHATLAVDRQQAGHAGHRMRVAELAGFQQRHESIGVEAECIRVGRGRARALASVCSAPCAAASTLRPARSPRACPGRSRLPRSLFASVHRARRCRRSRRPADPRRDGSERGRSERPCTGCAPTNTNCASPRRRGSNSRREPIVALRALARWRLSSMSSSCVIGSE